MKKTTITLILLLFTLIAIGQNNCSNAQQITVGANSSTPVNASQLTGTTLTNPCLYDNTVTAQNAGWFSYTPAQDLMVTVTSNTVTQNTDYFATMSLLTGTCSNLTCLDWDYVGSNGSSTNPNYTAEIEFYAQSGTTYFIYFDDLYYQLGNGSTGPFTFTVSTSTNLPPVPGIATNPVPNNGATVAIDTNDNNQDGNPDMSSSFQWDAPSTGGSATSYDFYLSDPTASDPTQLSLLGSVGSTSANVTGLIYGSTYYWMVVASNGSGDAVGSTTWSFTTENDPNAPAAAINPTPIDQAINVDIFTSTNNNGNPVDAIMLGWEQPNTGGLVDNYDIYLGTSPNSMSLIGNSTNASFEVYNPNYSTTYYWGVIGYTSGGASVNSEIWSFTTEDDNTMSVNDFETNQLTHYTNNGILVIDAEAQLENVEIYSILGKKVGSEILNGNSANINIAHLQKGVYLAKVSAEGQTKTFKFIKK